MITCYRKQYAVGQGGLHLGMVSYPYHYMNVYNNFAYIYDCGCSGGENIIKKNIDDIIDKLQKTKTLKYLYIFISHVHADHTNGIKYLCEQLIKSELYNKIPPEHIVFVLPFMSETDKLMAIGGLLFKDENNIINNEPLYFIQNPRNIIDEEFDIQYLSDIPPQRTLLYQRFDSYDIPPTHNGFLSHSDSFIFQATNKKYNWLILPYYYRGNCKKIKQLQKELNDMGININNFRDDEHLRNLRKIYNKYCSDINLPSLCLYSGANDIIDYIHTGWLHTGDIDFNKDEQVAYKGLIYHYKFLLNNIRVIQIPHHGSSENSKMKDFSIFNNVNTYFITTQSVTNGWQYPHVSNEYKNNDRIILLTEDYKKHLWSYEQGNGVIWGNIV